MSSLGIYFGPKIISVVDTKGRKVAANIRIPQSAIATGELELEEKVPAEVKIVAILKDELRKSNIAAKEATLCLCGNDIIVRTFDMPPLPREELQAAINFEAKKYIPFKLEELISDCQLQFDKASNKNIVLFIGIKKEVLSRYVAALSQLNIKVSALEYSAFSLTRVLPLAGLSDKGVVAIFGADLNEEDEVNFTVLENGFPLFSRDISLFGLPEEFAKGQGAVDPGMNLEKLKTEIRVSLDYFHRKFPAKSIGKIFFLSNEEYRRDIETFAAEIGLSVKFIDIVKAIGADAPYSLSFVKGFSASLSKLIKTNIKPNLLTVKEKVKAAPLETAALLKGLKVDYKIVALGLLICAATFGFGIYRALPLRKELSEIKGRRPNVPAVNPEATNEQLNSTETEYKKKLKALDDLVKKQLFLTEPLDAIPRAIPDGVWLRHFSFNKSEDSKASLILEGAAYLADADAEFQAVNQFLSNLKANPVFNKYFSNININSLDRSEQDKIAETKFKISCTNY